MKKIDKTVLSETHYIFLCVLILSALMQAVFLICEKWDVSVLFGNLLGGTAAVLNFFLMGITVWKSLEKEEKDAKNLMKLSQTYRSFMLLCVAGGGVLFSCFNTWAVLVPLFFPRIAIFARGFLDRKGGEEN